jgi:hypothetical protein
MRQILIALLASPLAAHAQTSYGRIVTDRISNKSTVQSAENVRTNRLPKGDAPFNEWYIFNSRFDLEELWRGNIFEAPLTPGQVCTFVNFDAGFALHNPEMESLVSLFWK